MNTTLKTREIKGVSFSYVNEEEFTEIYDSIFKDNAWKFTANTHSPFIIDCGAHIGVSVLYFKKLYPQAKVLAFEPNPETFKLLELNVRQNNIRDVELVNAALSNRTGEIDFYVCKETSDPFTWPWAFAGVKNAWYNPDTYQTIKVLGVNLSSFINQSVDFLKLDIEGMEEIVLEEIEDKLGFIKEIRMEFHGSSTNEDNSLKRILVLLKKKRFKFTLIRGGKVIIIDQISLVKIDKLKREQPYLLAIYTNRRRSGLWWQFLMLLIDAVHRRMFQKKSSPEGRF